MKTIDRTGPVEELYEVAGTLLLRQYKVKMSGRAMSYRMCLTNSLAKDGYSKEANPRSGYFCDLMN
jgi:hypothetical protein